MTMLCMYVCMCMTLKFLYGSYGAHKGICTLAFHTKCVTPFELARLGLPCTCCVLLYQCLTRRNGMHL